MDIVLPFLEPIKEQLPQHTDVTTTELNFVVGQQPMQPVLRKSGLAKQRVAPDGTIEWRLELSGDRLQLLCQQYRTWQDEYALAWSFISAICKGLIAARPAAQVYQAGFGVMDKFYYDPEPTDQAYAMKDIFRNDSPYLTTFAQRAGKLWHVYQGWFSSEGPLEECRLLHSLNIASKQEPPRGLTAVIDHNMNFNLVDGKNPPTLKDLFGDGTMRSRLAAAYQFAHDCNKLIFRDVVTREICTLVNMDSNARH